MRIYILTHGNKVPGPNPGITEDAKKALSEAYIPPWVNNIFVGTGLRFKETLAAIMPKFGQGAIVSVNFSPLCGSADSGEKAETGFQVVLADGTIVPAGNYTGLVGTPGIDLGAWLRTLPDKTLLVAGRELTGALGYEGGVPGKLYCYDGSEVHQVVALR